MFLTPKWLLSHVFVAVLIASFIAAGFWQLDRLGVRQDENRVVESRIDTPATDLDAVRDLEAELAEFLPVALSGTYALDRQILVANRSDEGTPGFWAWTVFETGAGDEVIVNRGFVPRTIVVGTPGALPLESIDPVEPNVAIQGLLRRGIASGRLSNDGTEISRPDAELAATALGLDGALDPDLYVELVIQEPAQETGLPSRVPPPDLSEGPHRSYAFQWFTFALLGVVGYAAVLLRIRRGDPSRGDVSPDV